MPPKKQVQEEKPLLGRPGNNLKVGILGLPNVGKSSFLSNALTQSAASAENYPFCTLDPEEARCSVVDPRFDWLCDHYKPASKVPAYLTVIDIAGLVKGAAEGQGLGNAFLSHVRAVDALYHVVRCFDDADIIHVEGDVNPVRDIEIIREELRLKDVEFLTKRVEEAESACRRIGHGGNAADKAKKEEFEILKKVYNYVAEEKKDVRKGEWNNKEIEVINSLLLLTAKPVIVLANLSEKDYARKKNKWLPKIKKWIDDNNPGDLLIPFSVQVETNLLNMSSDEEREAYLKELSEKYPCPLPCRSVLPKIISAGYSALQLIYFFTGGPDEVRAWTIRKGTKAPQAAGVIHTDFEKGFIMAEVMKYDDMHELGTDAAVKAAGKYKQKGKDYVVEDGDIIYFKFNVTTQGKKK